MTDAHLLQKHREGNPEAFAELVRRHAGWVYGVARRRLRDTHLAEDVTQAVFVLLHRKSPHFDADAAMMRWLHRSAWYCSEVALRSRRRLRHRETQAAMTQAVESSGSEWDDLAPLLDELIGQLSATDREAVLLRFYRQLPFADVGASIGTSEDTARKRVERAIEKLRHLAERRGLTVSASALAVSLTEQISTSAPAGLIAAATGAATSSAGAALLGGVTPILNGALIMMNAKLIVITAVAAIVVAGGAAIYVTRPSSPAPVAAKSQPPTTSTQAPVFVNEDVQFAGSNYPKLAPYSAIRWQAETPEIQLDSTWYELIAIDGRRVQEIIQFTKAVDRKNWQKRFDEDLVEVMSRMGQETKDTVKLTLKTLDKKELVTRENVPMTKDNRQSIWRARQAATSSPNAGEL